MLVRLTFGLSLALLTLALACGGDSGDPSLEPVSVARIRTGEMVGGDCIFAADLSGYPVTFSDVSGKCDQAVTIGPMSLAELERMKQDEPSFWQNSLPYRQALVGERIDSECDFSHPAVQAYLEFSETVSIDLAGCVMIVDVGPATEEQIGSVQRYGTASADPAVPASLAPGER